MAADVSVTAFNKYPVSFVVPPLGFDILVPGCSNDEPYILLANATTKEIHVNAAEQVAVEAEGIVRQIPETLLTICPDSEKSPLDAILADYMSGTETTIFVRGAESPIGDTPAWMSELIKSVMVPVPFTGHSFDNLIKDFSMTNVHLGLPNPLADPGTPDAHPKISALVQVTANLPKEMNFPIDVTRVRADAKVFYKENQLGILDLHKWQPSSSKRVAADGDAPPSIVVKSEVKNAPLNITDDDVFSDVVQALLFGGKSVILEVEANVDIETSTALGKFVIRDVPAKGKVPVKR